MSTSQPSIDIPKKRAGAAYTIVLASADEAVQRGRARTTGRQAIGFPRPAFDDLCICCNQPASGNRHVYTPWVGTGYAVRGIELPLCTECIDHAFDHPDPQGFALLPLIPGAIAVGVGLWRASPILQIIGVGLIAAALVLGAVLRWRKVRRRRTCHHQGIDIDATPGRLRIATRNPELVRSVITLNRRLIRRVR